MVETSRQQILSAAYLVDSYASSHLLRRAAAQHRDTFTRAVLVLLMLLTLQGCAVARSTISPTPTTESAPKVELTNPKFVTDIENWFTNTYPASPQDEVVAAGGPTGKTVEKGPYAGYEIQGTNDARVTVVSMTEYQEGKDTGYIFALGFHDGDGNIKGNKGLVLLAVPENTVVDIQTVFIPDGPFNSNPALNSANGLAEEWQGQGGNESGSILFSVTEIPISELYNAYLHAQDNYSEVRGYENPGDTPGKITFGNGKTLTVTFEDLKLGNSLYYISQPDETVASEMENTNFSLPIFDASTDNQISQHMDQVVVFGPNTTTNTKNGTLLRISIPGDVDNNQSDLFTLLSGLSKHGIAGSPYAKGFKINGVNAPPVSVAPIFTS